MAERAPLNDAHLLTLIQTYQNFAIRDAASKAFHRHLWFLAEHLVELASLDPRVDVTVKKEMVNNLQRTAHANNLKRLNSSTLNHEHFLDIYVIRRTGELFYVILNNGEEKATRFLHKDPCDWQSDPVYKEMGKRVKQMKVVNDRAEQAIALIQSYNTSLTNDEDL